MSWQLNDPGCVRKSGLGELRCFSPLQEPHQKCIVECKVTGRPKNDSFFRCCRGLAEAVFDRRDSLVRNVSKSTCKRCHFLHFFCAIAMGVGRLVREGVHWVMGREFLLRTFNVKNDMWEPYETRTVRTPG